MSVLIRHFARSVAITLPALFCMELRGYGQQRYLLEETTIVSGMASAFEPAQADYCAAVLRGGAPQCAVLSPTTFSSPGLYFTLLRFSSFGHYDEGTYTSRGLTPEAAKELRKRREPTVRENQESALTLHEKSSYSSTHPGALVRVVDVTIRPGTVSQLLRYVQQVEVPAAHRAGMLSSELYQVVAGGNTERFLLLQRFERFKQLDALPAFGETAPAPKGTSIVGCVETSRTTVMRSQVNQEVQP